MAAAEESFFGKFSKEMPMMKHCLTLERGASTLMWFQRAYETVYGVEGATAVAMFACMAMQAYWFYKKCCASSDKSRV